MGTQRVYILLKQISSITNDAEDKSWQMLYVGQSPTKWTVVQQYP